MELTINQALQKAAEAHKKGQIRDANRLYTAILKAQPKHPDANHNLGVLAVSVGKVEKALPFFKTALEANLRNGQFWLSYIDALLKLGRKADAKTVFDQAKKKGIKDKTFDKLEQTMGKAFKLTDPPKDQLELLINLYRQDQYQKSFERAEILIKKFPMSAILHSIRGASLKGLGQHELAIKSYSNALAIKPDYAEAYNNMGVSLQDQGKLQDAIRAFKKALAIKPNYAEAHNNIGIVLSEQEKPEEAIRAYKMALGIKPKFSEAYNNLGSAFSEQEKIEEAIEAYNHAVTINPYYAEAYKNMGNALKGMRFSRYENWIEAALLAILNGKTIVRPSDIAGAVVSLIKSRPNMKDLLAVEFSKVSTGQFEKIISDLSDTPILLKLIEVVPLPDPELEQILTEIRSYILQNISKISIGPAFLKIQSALAIQCYTNEYVFNFKEKDAEVLNLLESSIEDILQKGDQPSPHKILCLAGYRALIEYRWHVQLRKNPDIDDVFNRQIVEPTEEKRLRPQIETLGKISNKISKKVRDQYEENPYPRWVNLGFASKPLRISEFVRKLKLYISDAAIASVDEPEILIAGCGTGQHALETAYRFKDSNVFAADLSLASLTYALRKTEELGVKNVTYTQTDILNLGKLKKQFDIVESAGVLHHMDDPVEGWRVLTDCLKPGGLMKIGLYSERARQEIVQMRQEISNAGIGSSYEEIKSFRAMLMTSDQDHHKKILNSSDFYSSSNLRDLLFHVQEHRFTIPQIRDCLSELGLKFCGFEGGRIVSQFKLINTKKGDLYDLDRWHKYEEANPKTFKAMYQFWCQKMT